MTYHALLTSRVALGRARKDYISVWLQALAYYGKPSPYWAREIEDVNDADLEALREMNTDKNWVHFDEEGFALPDDTRVLDGMGEVRS